MRQGGLLFDLDGTLLDTAPDFAQCLNQLLLEQEQRTLSLEQIRPFVSHGVQGLLGFGFGIDPSHKQYAQLRDRLLHLYETVLGEKSLFFPGVQALLAQLKLENIPWGIVTNKPHRFTEPLLKKLALFDQTHCVVSGDTLAKSKPEPEPIWHACQLLNIKPQFSFYIGDAQRDVQASHSAGLKSIVVNYGYFESRESCMSWKAHYYVDEPTEIYQIYMNHKI